MKRKLQLHRRLSCLVTLCILFVLFFLIFVAFVRAYVFLSTLFLHSSWLFSIWSICQFGPSCISSPLQRFNDPHLYFFLFRNTSLYYALPLNVEYSHVRMDLLGTDHLSVRFDFNGFCDTKHQFVMTAGTMSRGS